MINRLKGDVTTATTGVISHIVNGRGIIGGGVSSSILSKWPGIYDIYMDMYKAKELKLGTVGFIQVDTNLFVANMVGQKGTISKKNPKPWHAKATEKCLTTVAEFAKDRELDISMPEIGGNLGGADFEVEVLPIIERVFSSFSQAVYIYKWSPTPKFGQLKHPLTE